jgi:hypothetical protein
MNMPNTIAIKAMSRRGSMRSESAEAIGAAGAVRTVAGMGRSGVVKAFEADR